MDQRVISALETTKRRARVGAERAKDVALFTYAVAKVWIGRARVWLARATRVTLAVLKQITLRTMIVLERLLLSHSSRERIQAAAVFTLIFAFAITSVDYLITGGPEFSMSARATPYTARASLIAPRSRDAGIELAMLETPAPAAPAAVVAEQRPVAAVTPLVEAAPEDEPARVELSDRDKPKPERT